MIEVGSDAGFIQIRAQLDPEVADDLAKALEDWGEPMPGELHELMVAIGVELGKMAEDPSEESVKHT